MAVVRKIDKKITHYLGDLSSQQKEVVLSVVKTFAVKEPLWNDKDYLAGMDRRLSEMGSGKVKGLTLNQMEAGTRRAYKNRKGQ